LSHTALGFARDLARACLTAQLPEKLAKLHHACRGDRIADSEETA
jgi:hypothetical protein